MLARTSVSLAALALAACGSEVPGGGEAAAEATTAPAEVLAQHAYSGMCDASAVVALDASTFVVANDEDNALRVYRVGTADPLNADEDGKIADDLSEFLDTRRKDEVDIEGAARIGTRVYWITSHGSNKDGEARPERRRLFATEITASGDQVTIAPVGTPYTGLVEDLAALPALQPFDLLAKAAIAPEQGGVNIEGLAAAPDGSLLLALRSPLADGAAIVVPLLNPAEVVTGAKPRFGTPLFPELGSRGVRSIEPAADGAGYIVVAGAVADGEFALFRWHPDATAEADRLTRVTVDFAGLYPEALSSLGGGRWLLLSDDGDVQIDGKACKDWKDTPAKQRFRGGEVGQI